MPDTTPVKENIVGRKVEEELPVSEEEELFGPELQVGQEVLPEQEAGILKEIDRLKEREMERKEITSPQLTPSDDAQTAMPSDDPAEEDINITGSLKYYGYEIPKQAIQDATAKAKGDLGLSDTWLRVFVSRILQME